MTQSDADTLVNGQRQNLSPGDRGIAYGDGVFETMRCVGADIPLLSWHLARLDRACDVLGLNAPEHSDWLRDIAKLTHSQASDERCIIKLVLTRGSGGFGYAPPEQQMPTRIVQRLPFPVSGSADELRCALLDECLGSNRRLAGIKHLNRLEQVLAARELRARQLDEGLVCNQHGFVVEGVSSNVVFVFDRRVVTPRLDVAGVQGVMRDVLIEAAQGTEWAISEDFVHRDAAAEADEIVFCNSVRGVRRASHFDGTALGKRRVFDQLHRMAEHVYRGQG